eukprot:4555090-Alexandrium_andersonii.AAC.1
MDSPDAVRCCVVGPIGQVCFGWPRGAPFSEQADAMAEVARAVRRAFLAEADGLMAVADL